MAGHKFGEFWSALQVVPLILVNSFLYVYMIYTRALKLGNFCFGESLEIAKIDKNSENRQNYIPTK